MRVLQLDQTRSIAQQARLYLQSMHDRFKRSRILLEPIRSPRCAGPHRERLSRSAGGFHSGRPRSLGAMTTNRPYQKAMEIACVFTRMQSFIEKQCEKHLVEALITAYEESLIRPKMKAQSVLKPSDAAPPPPTPAPSAELPAPRALDGAPGRERSLDVTRIAVADPGSVIASSR